MIDWAQFPLLQIKKSTAYGANLTLDEGFEEVIVLPVIHW